MKKRHADVAKVKQVVELIVIQDKKQLEKYKDHVLKGDWQGFRELHSEKNWLLIYFIDKEQLVLTLMRTGTHDELF